MCSEEGFFSSFFNIWIYSQYCDNSLKQKFEEKSLPKTLGTNHRNQSLSEQREIPDSCFPRITHLLGFAAFFLKPA